MPGGRPACKAISAMRSVLRGDFSLGLSTTELSAASACAIFQADMTRG